MKRNLEIHDVLYGKLSCVCYTILSNRHWEAQSKEITSVPVPSAGSGWELAQRKDLILMFCKCIQGCHYSDSSCIQAKSAILLASYKMVQTCRRKQFKTNRRVITVILTQLLQSESVLNFTPPNRTFLNYGCNKMLKQSMVLKYLIHWTFIFSN